MIDSFIDLDVAAAVLYLALHDFHHALNRSSARSFWIMRVAQVFGKQALAAVIIFAEITFGIGHNYPSFNVS